jgi:hypothetical protein
MPLKRKDGTIESNPTIYERVSRAFGINFELKGKIQLFAPYSFFSHAQMNGDEEIIFHYTFGVVRVKGDHLDFIYSLARSHELASINCTTDDATKPEDPRIKQILFEAIGEGI